MSNKKNLLINNKPKSILKKWMNWIKLKAMKKYQDLIN